MARRKEGRSGARAVALESSCSQARLSPSPVPSPVGACGSQTAGCYRTQAITAGAEGGGVAARGGWLLSYLIINRIAQNKQRSFLGDLANCVLSIAESTALLLYSAVSYTLAPVPGLSMSSSFIRKRKEPDGGKCFCCSRSGSFLRKRSLKRGKLFWHGCSNPSQTSVAQGPAQGVCGCVCAHIRPRQASASVTRSYLANVNIFILIKIMPIISN